MTSVYATAGRPQPGWQCRPRSTSADSAESPARTHSDKCTNRHTHAHGDNTRVHMHKQVDTRIHKRICMATHSQAHCGHMHTQTHSNTQEHTFHPPRQDPRPAAEFHLLGHAGTTVRVWGGLHSFPQQLHHLTAVPSVPISLHCVNTWLFSGFGVIATLMDVKCYLIVVLISIFLMISVKHLFMCLLAICTSSLGNVYLDPFNWVVHFVVVDL